MLVVWSSHACGHFLDARTGRRIDALDNQLDCHSSGPNAAKKRDFLAQLPLSGFAMSQFSGDAKMKFL